MSDRLALLRAEAPQEQEDAGTGLQPGAPPTGQGGAGPVWRRASFKWVLASLLGACLLLALLRGLSPSVPRLRRPTPQGEGSDVLIVAPQQAEGVQQQAHPVPPRDKGPGEDAEGAEAATTEARAKAGREGTPPPATEAPRDSAVGKAGTPTGTAADVAPEPRPGGAGQDTTAAPPPSFSLISSGTFCDPSSYLWSGQDSDCRERCLQSAQCRYYTSYVNTWCQIVAAKGCNFKQLAEDLSSETYAKGATDEVPQTSFNWHSSGSFCEPQGYLWSGMDARCKERCGVFVDCKFFTAYANGWCQLINEAGCTSEATADDSSAVTYSKDNKVDQAVAQATEAAEAKVEAEDAGQSNSIAAADANAIAEAAADAKAGAAAKAKAEAAAAAMAEAAAVAKREAAAKAEVEAEAKAAAEAKAKAEVAANAKAEAAARAKAAAKATAEVEAKVEAEAAAEAERQAARKAKAAAEAKAMAEAVAEAKAEAEAKAAAEAKAKAEAAAKVQAAAKAKAEAEAKAAAEAKAKAEAAARADAAAKAKAEGEAKAAADAKAKAEAAARADAAAEAKAEEAETTDRPVSPPKTRAPENCTGIGEDCRSSKCCRFQGMQCYAKNEWWAACQGTCTTEGTDWSCQKLGVRSPQKNAATWAGEDCSLTRLCANAGTKCLRKDVMTAYCAPETSPGWDGEILGGTRSEYYAQAVPPGEDAAVAPGGSLFCFMAVLRGSSEEQLEQRARDLHAGIFSDGCQANAVYDAAPAVWASEGSWQSFMNTDAFVTVWQKVKEDGRYLNYSWTVKVDPDTVFMPYRLQYKLQNLRAPAGKPVYIKNCNVDFGFLGAIEIINRMALLNLFDNIDDCHRTMGSHSGEDGFVKGCLDAVGSGYMTDATILKTPHDTDCGDGSRVAFHPHKDPGGWQNCYNVAMGTTLYKKRLS